MALPSSRIIYGPGKEIMEMLLRRVPPSCRNELERACADALGLIQTNVVDLLYLGDMAQKAANVYPIELNGSCPQHIATLALLGEVAAVNTAMEAIQRALAGAL